MCSGLRTVTLGLAKTPVGQHALRTGAGRKTALEFASAQSSRQWYSAHSTFSQTARNGSTNIHSRTWVFGKPSSTEN
jgi:hypothetical protein